MAREETTIGEARLICGKAEEVLPTLPPASVHLIIVDPPYFRMKLTYAGQPLAWDRQWPSRGAYLGWLRGLAKEWQRLLTPNGSLYCFAAPQMAAWVEVALSETFNILTRIQWLKSEGWHKRIAASELCSYVSPREEILFAEQYGSDNGYHDALLTEHASYSTAGRRLKGSIFGAYLKAEFTRAGITQQQIAALFPSQRGGMTGCVSNWFLGYNRPTSEQYSRIRSYLNSRKGHANYLCREYEDLRREYEDVRRPFTVSANAPFTDTWDFATVPAAPGKHPAEKPLPLLRHIIEVSSRPGNIVMDCCAGSFSTLEAAKQCGRQGIGIEQERTWWQRGQARLRQETLLTAPPTRKAVVPVQPSLFVKELGNAEKHDAADPHKGDCAERR